MTQVELHILDPEDNGFVIGFFSGQKSDGTAIEVS